MKSDEGFSDMLDKTILIQYQYENVIPNLLKQKLLVSFKYQKILKD